MPAPSPTGPGTEPTTQTHEQQPGQEQAAQAHEQLSEVGRMLEQQEQEQEQDRDLGHGIE